MGFFSRDIADHILDAAHLGLLGAFGVARELRRLPDMLLDDESVLAVTRGRVDSTGWVMAVTDARILLLHKGLLFGFKHLEVPIARVKSASFRTGLMSGAIFIDTGGGTVVLEGINKKCTVEVASVISRLINDPAERRSRDDDGATGKLERLAALRDKGVLTEAEFLSQKRRIIGQAKAELTVTRLGPNQRPAPAEPQRPGRAAAPPETARRPAKPEPARPARPETADQARPETARPARPELARPARPEATRPARPDPAHTAKTDYPRPAKPDVKS